MTTCTDRRNEPRVLWRLIAMWAVVFVICVGAPGIQRSASTAFAAPRSPSSTPSIYFGLFYPSAPDLGNLHQVESEIGKGASLVLWYQDWVQFGRWQAFPTQQMEAIRRHGSIPVLAWQPIPYRTTATSAFSLAKIASGAWDSDLQQYAKQAAAWGHPFFLRFASEMNGSWTLWSEGRNGNAQGDFIKAWRHVHHIFAAAGATNVTWVWCPNVVTAATEPLKYLYPGDAYVDWVGMDGYNYGPVQGEVPWRSFSDVFQETYKQVLSLAPGKPIMVGETASVEAGGSKAAWIQDALGTELRSHFPKVKGLIWFDAIDGDIDLRMDTSAASLQAVREGVASSVYPANIYSALLQHPIPVPSLVVPLPAASMRSPASPQTQSLRGPPFGTIQFVNAQNGHPLANVVLVYQTGAWNITDAKGQAALPKGESSPVLLRYMVGTKAIGTTLPLDPNVGYQVQVNPTTGKVENIINHLSSLPAPTIADLPSIAVPAILGGLLALCVLALMAMALVQRRVIGSKAARRPSRPRVGQPWS